MLMERTPWPTEGTRLVHEVQPTGFGPVTEEALAEIVRRIVTALRPEKIVLFGSYAYGTPWRDSDVDLLVVMHTHARPADRYLTVSRLLRPRPFPLDILIKTPAEVVQALTKGDGFLRDIVTQGRVLYERSD
jgi:predicted nucleotidyltransferase